MSSDNAKLNLVTDQDAGEALREMGYEPEHVEGTNAEQAKALLEGARADLDEALDRIEEDTYAHEIVGSAYDELEFVINQTWPTENGKQWQDGSDPVDHAVSCFMLCREIAIDGDQSAPSTGLVHEAADNVYRAATLLWGSKFTAELESRRDEADQRRAAAMAMLEAEGIDTMEATENLLEAMLDRAAEFPIASREEAVRALEDAMVGTSALAGALLALTGTRDEAASDALLKAGKEAGNATMQTMRAITYLKERDDGAEQADRDEDDTEEEERLFSHRIDRAIDEAKQRAKVTAPQSAEEAADNLYDVVNDVATALVAMRLYEDVDTEYYGRLFGSTLVKAARALHYLNGGTFADRDHTDERTMTTIGDLSIILDSYARGDYPCPDRQRDWERIYEGAYTLDVDEPTEAADLLFWALIALERHRLENGDHDECSDVNSAKRHIETAIDILWPEKDEQPDHDHGSTATAENATTDGESLDETPYVEVGYADGSSVRITGHFGTDTIADVARLATRTTAPTEEEEV